MKLLRRYQLDIIFLYVALFVIVGLTFLAIGYLGGDPHDYQWFTVGPLIVFYVIYLLSIRKKINIDDRRQWSGKSLVYWIILGIMIVSSYKTPLSARDYWSMELMFIAFTILLADSYWDFKKISIRNLAENKEELDKV